MKCHYEVLGLSRDASDAEIKTAYRKLALQWHPDKNLDQVEEAKEQFQLIQQAYEVLSDHHERAWYDNHREQILRGKNSNYEDESLDLFPYFTASCFKGYNDDSTGFYSVYREVFEKIRQEDAEFLADTDESESIPMFGNAESKYEEVVGPFYAYWQSYCTKKSYTWLCPYNINEIKDRRILREVEKEMKKIVQKARKERNEEVRNLVAFVRKRDKRVQANKKLLEDRAALNRMKQEQNRLEQIRRRQKELDEHYKNHRSHGAEDYEEQLRQLTQQYADSDDDYVSSELDEAEELAESVDEIELEESEKYFIDDLYCVACNKSFKNLSARLNHEASKKHRDNTNKLKDKMKYEEQLLAGISENETNYCDDMNGDDSAEDNISDEETMVEIKSKGKKDKKFRRNKIEIKLNEDEEEVPDILGEVLKEKDDWDSEKKNKKGKQKKLNAKTVSADKSLHKELNPPVKSVAKATVDEAETSECDNSNRCVTCKNVFPSKNKLFQHLKATGHGVHIPKDEQTETNRKRGKRMK